MRDFRFFFAALFVLGMSSFCNASTDVNVDASSFTFSGVNVGSGTLQLVDNYIGGVQVSTYNAIFLTTGSYNLSRIGIEIQNLDSTNAIFCGYNLNVSTTVGTGTALQNNNVGFRIKAGDVRLVGMATAATRYYCQAVDAAAGSGVWTHLEWIYKQ